MTAPFFLRIFRRDSDGHLTGETVDGRLHPLTDFVDDESLVAGDIVRVRGQVWEKADAENWVDQYRVGVVRSIEGKRAVLATEDGIVDADNSEGLTLTEGNTVRIDVRNTIVELVSREPIDRLPIKIDRDDDGMDVALLIQDTSKATLEWENFGGLADLVDHAKEIVDVHLMRRGEYAALGVTPLRGVIFEGPPGTGKTHLARIMAHKAEAVLYVVGAAELGGRLVGESEGRLQKIYDHAANNPLSIIFIDELDGISRQRGDSGGSHSDRLVGTFLVNMDGFNAKDNVLTIGTTNRIDDIDIALRRPGRFGTELRFRRPTTDDRRAILEARAKTLQTVGMLSHDLVAQETEGWTPADLDEVWTQAATQSIKSGSTAIADEHYLIGLERVQRLKPGKTKQA